MTISTEDQWNAALATADDLLLSLTQLPADIVGPSVAMVLAELVMNAGTDNKARDLAMLKGVYEYMQRHIKTSYDMRARGSGLTH